MNKNLFSRTAATSFVLGLAMAASAQQAEGGIQVFYRCPEGRAGQCLRPWSSLPSCGNTSAQDIYE